MDRTPEQFVEAMGRHLEEEGVARIAGRLMGALMLNLEPASLDELAEQLQVSKGSISANARLLEQWGVAEKVTLPGDRRDYYQIAEDVEARVLQRQIERSRVLLARLREGREAVGDRPERVRRRFDGVVAFHERALDVLERELRSLRKLRPR